MGIIEILIIVIASIIVLAVIGITVWRKIKGKSGGCGCGDCSHCSGCGHSQSKKKPNNK